ncbi:MAG: hypothetical protein ACRELX_10485, partial [Longimicrobiales bacterium]
AVTINLTGGQAEVEMRRIRPKTATEQALYVVKSTGVRTAGANQWNPAAEHTVAQYAFFREGSMQVLAGWTSLSGLVKNGGSGTISGEDNCGVMPDVAGAAVPTTTAIGTPGYEQSGGGGGSVPEGNPPILHPAATPAAMVPMVKIDWDGIVNHNAIVPDLVIPGDSWPSATAFSSNPNYWPVIRLNDPDWSMPSHGGRGTIIATGNLTIPGNTTFEGIVLVGGMLTSNGNNNVLGATVSALNVMLGIAVPISDVGNGTKTYQYDSCNVAAATSRFATLVQIPGTWSDNWPGW